MMKILIKKYREQFYLMKLFIRGEIIPPKCHIFLLTKSQCCTFQIIIYDIKTFLNRLFVAFIENRDKTELDIVY